MNNQKRIGLGTFLSCSLAVIAFPGCGPKADRSVRAEPAAAVASDSASTPSEQESVEAVDPPVAEKSPEVRMSDDAFRAAAHDGKVDVVRRAIESGKDVNAKEPSTKHTALLLAAYNGHTDVVKLLLKHDAIVDSRDAEGKTPLLHACTGPFPETVELLISAGADINAAEATEGFTPLMMAAGIGEADVVEVLLKHNADKTIKDQDQDTALSHAKNSGHVKIVSLLKDK